MVSEAPRGDQHAPEVIFAEQWCAQHIGELIRFRLWDDTREIATVITAELRQLSHDGNVTHVRHGLGAESEATLEHHDRVILRPLPDYSEVHGLLGVDPIEVQWRAK
ncbi:MAG: hypothetical protein ACPGVG_12160 [Mycobacterium sp.]